MDKNLYSADTLYYKGDTSEGPEGVCLIQVWLYNTASHRCSVFFFIKTKRKINYTSWKIY